MAYKKLKPLKSDSVKKLQEAFAIGADVSAACSYAQISRQTFYNWTKENKKLQEEFDSLREKPVLKAYQTVYSDLGSIDTAKWYLERKRKKEFSTMQEVESKNQDTLTVKFATGPSQFIKTEKKVEEKVKKAKKKAAPKTKKK